MTNNLDFLKSIKTDTTILTPNRRLSATLHKFQRKFILNKKQTCWQTPTILPITSWVKSLWDKLLAYDIESFPLLLNTSQEQLLWEKILANTKESEHLLQLSQTAEITQSAFSLLRQWQIDIHLPIFKTTDDSLTLFHWLSAFENHCKKNHVTGNASLPDLIKQEIKKQHIIPENRILLFGFTELSPQLQDLLKTCQEAGSIIEHIELSKANNVSQRITFKQLDDEILTCARWAKKTLEKNNGDCLIGCVFPTLETMRDRIMQIFTDVFSDHFAFNISAGKSLAQYPIIHAALQLLTLQKQSVSLEVFSYLLTSPFLGEAENERIKRAHFETFLRRSNTTHIAFNDERIPIDKYSPQLAKRLRTFSALLFHPSKMQSYSAWARHFHDLLTVLGWPGERSLNSNEYQVVEAWLKLLTEFMTLDHVDGAVNFQKALHMLNKMAQQHTFQPQTPDANIQILGVLEAAALPFDYLWITGMDDLTWPPQPQPNPLIPKALQREKHMPHATAERELIYCQRLLKQFKQSATKVIFSHTEKIDELELQASPLIRDLPVIDLPLLELDPYQLPSEMIYNSKSIQSIVDETGPPVGEQEKILGGINVIKQQALCPFKAFAQWRLHAHELETPLIGLRAKDRGTLLHKILEHLWRKLKSHANLYQMNASLLDEIIDESIENVLSSLTHYENTRYMHLEKQRLQKLIVAWLQLEKTRSPFTIHALEECYEVKLNQLHLSVRIDRIDELENGHKLIIDYKTGKHNDLNHFFSERPEEPQLPLYAIFKPEETIAIAFAQLIPGEHCFKGVSKYTLDIDGIKIISAIKKAQLKTWEEQMTQWQNTFLKLSCDFSQGKANVDPKNYPQTCTWCALKPLCRIGEEQH